MSTEATPKRDRLNFYYLVCGTLASIAIVGGFCHELIKPRGDNSLSKISASTQESSPTSNLEVQPAPPPTPLDLRTPFERMRDEMVEVLRKGPDFSGTVTDADGNESPIEFSVTWNDTAQKATGEFHFLTSDNRIKVDGPIRFTDDHRQVALYLSNRSYDQNSFYTLNIAAIGQSVLTGTFHFRDSAIIRKIVLHPSDMK